MLKKLENENIKGLTKLIADLGLFKKSNVGYLNLHVAKLKRMGYKYDKIFEKKFFIKQFMINI